LSFVGGDRLGSLESVAVRPVDPEQEVDISVPMRTPSKPGRYVSYWRLVNVDGTRFGQRVWADIVVVNKPKEVKVRFMDQEKWTSHYLGETPSCVPGTPQRESKVELKEEPREAFYEIKFGFSNPAPSATQEQPKESKVEVELKEELHVLTKPVEEKELALQQEYDPKINSQSSVPSEETKEEEIETPVMPEELEVNADEIVKEEPTVVGESENPDVSSSQQDLIDLESPEIVIKDDEIIAFEDSGLEVPYDFTLIPANEPTEDIEVKMDSPDFTTQSPLEPLKQEETPEVSQPTDKPLSPEAQQLFEMGFRNIPFNEELLVRHNNSLLPVIQDLLNTL